MGGGTLGPLPQTEFPAASKKFEVITASPVNYRVHNTIAVGVKTVVA